MSRSQSLEKRARLVILEQMEELGEMTTEAVMELVRPHYIFDPHRAREREIRKKANSLMAQLRDEKGIRTCFNYKTQDGQSIYVNIDKTKDMNALDRVAHQISLKYYGLDESKRKIERRKQELSGQLALFEQAKGD